MIKNKMIMTKKLADTIMDAHCALAVAAMSSESNGKITVEMMEQAGDFARSSFTALATSFEEAFDAEWEIIGD